MVDSNRDGYGGSPERIRPFARDVAVSMVANLAAAGIVYILAVIGGYVRAKPAVLVLAVVLILPGVLSIVMVVVGGVKYMKSGGDSGNMTSAKSTIVWALVLLIGALTIWVGRLAGRPLQFGGLGWAIGIVGVIFFVAVSAAIWLLRRKGSSIVHVVAGFLSILLSLFAFGGLLGAMLPDL